jgi:hypothetical protein
MLPAMAETKNNNTWGPPGEAAIEALIARWQGRESGPERGKRSPLAETVAVPRSDPVVVHTIFASGLLQPVLPLQFPQSLSHSHLVKNALNNRSYIVPRLRCSISGADVDRG